MSNQRKADLLMEASSEVWEELNICCGWSSRKGDDKNGYSVEERKAAHDTLMVKKVKNLGYSQDKKVSKSVRGILESENFHSLNRVLEENGLGAGNY